MKDGTTPTCVCCTRKLWPTANNSNYSNYNINHNRHHPC